MKATAAAKAASASSVVVSSTRASSAGTNGAARRWLSRASRSFMSCRTALVYSGLAGSPATPWLGAAARASGVAVTKSLASASGQITVPMSRPSSTAPGWPPGRMAGEVALEVEQRRAHRRDRRHHRGGLRHLLVAQPRVGEVAGLDRRRRRGRCRRVGGIAAGCQHAPRHGAVERRRYRDAPGRNVAASRRASVPLPDGGRPVDGDDHAARGARSRRRGAVHQRDESPESWWRWWRRRRPAPAAAPPCPAPGTPWRCGGRAGWRSSAPPGGGPPSPVDDQRVARDLDRDAAGGEALRRWRRAGRSP